MLSNSNKALLLTPLPLRQNVFFENVGKYLFCVHFYVITKNW